MADAISSDPATLLTIPAEMQKAIADVIDNQGLLALRLVNKKLHAAVDDSFLERFFTTRRHVMTLHGLIALVEITMRPSLIRKLKKIVLVYMEPVFYGQKSDDKPPDPGQRDMLHELGVSRWDREFHELFRGGHAEQLLQQVLKNVVGRCPTLEIADLFNIKYETTFGCRLLTRSFGLKESDVEFSETAFDVPTLLSSIELANFPIRDLDISISDYNSAKCLENAFGNIRSPPAPCWANLSALSLHLPGATIHWNGGKDLALLEFIKAATNIRSLNLQIGIWDFGTDSSHVLARLGEAFKKHSLHDVKLRYFNTGLWPFIGFLQHQRNTLKSVALFEHVLLNDCWSKVFACFHQDFALERIQISSMKRNTEEGIELMVEEGGRRRVDLQGEAAVQQGLEQLTSEKLRYDDISW